MTRNKPLVSETRNYLVRTVAEAHKIIRIWLTEIDLHNVVSLGLAEIDDRYHVWRIPLLKFDRRTRIGEAVIDAYTTAIDLEKTTRPDLLEARLLKKDESRVEARRKPKIAYPISSLRNTIALGDCADLLDEMPAGSVDLVFTSPPYFNARPQYSEFEEYEQYPVSYTHLTLPTSDLV